MLISFELSMPGCNSWNGRWSGEDSLFVALRRFTSKKALAKAKEVLLAQPYYYRWDDGWAANIAVAEVNSQQARNLKRRSQGFCGYDDWMIDSILTYGAIYAYQERPKQAVTT